jgi:nitrite reductase/ring-hydroxylating ferredoxin subunit
VGGGVCAIANTCTHRGGPLNEGERDGNVVTCPWHGSQFDLCSGEVLRVPAREPERCFEVRVREGKIEVRRGVLEQVDDYDIASVDLALAARTAAERVAVS